MEALAIYLAISSKLGGKYFQHNHNHKITLETFAYVREYKRQLLQSMALLLADLDIKYVISHGNLIEHERQALIYHDDDIDVRYDIKDLPKWERFCKEHETLGAKYNIKIGDHGQYKKISDQKNNGVHVRLRHFDNRLQLKTFKKFDIFMDFVPSVAELWFKTKYWWPPYDIDIPDLRTVEYRCKLRIKKTRSVSSLGSMERIILYLTRSGCGVTVRPGGSASATPGA